MSTVRTPLLVLTAFVLAATAACGSSTDPEPAAVTSAASSSATSPTSTSTTTSTATTAPPEADPYAALRAVDWERRSYASLLDGTPHVPGSDGLTYLGTAYGAMDGVPRALVVLFDERFADELNSGVVLHLFADPEGQPVSGGLFDDEAGGQRLAHAAVRIAEDQVQVWANTAAPGSTAQSPYSRYEVYVTTAGDPYLRAGDPRPAEGNPPGDAVTWNGTAPDPRTPLPDVGAPLS
ncbi:hypothetical protein [Kineococcus indalonis]|uniref:hypothetical protein n=1 Tax=Kineococcus indalonis TaxID=2696566 RepID=UPI0014129981|nr:hypothetical protein [Kineococcus indalonis]NAZ87211.1 hypothetical protein [Kineococcus indalonis]